MFPSGSADGSFEMISKNFRNTACSTLLVSSFLVLSPPLRGGSIPPGPHGFLSTGGERFLLLAPTLRGSFDKRGLSLRAAGMQLRVEFDQATGPFRIEGLEPQDARINILHPAAFSRDRHGVLSRARTWRAIAYRRLYPGIDLIYSVHNRLKYEFRVAPGADPSRIRIRYRGAERVELDESGSLWIAGPSGALRELPPVVFQEHRGGRTAVNGEYLLHADGSFGFRIGAYDRNRELVIDPEIVTSTYFGGSMFDSITAVTADSAGNTYFAGWTESLDLPLMNPRQGSSGGRTDVIIGKVGPGGNLLYATYLGGAGNDRAHGIALDPAGNIVVVGETESANFPVWASAQSAFGGFRDAFVVKLNPSGSTILFSTLLGGRSADSAAGVAVDGQGNIFVAGSTASDNFPRVNAFQNSFGGVQDAFLAKYSPTGGLLASTYLGGSGFDRATGVAVDPSGRPYVVGGTSSFNFPVLQAVQPSLQGGQDGFVTKFAANGSSLLYSTYFGGLGGSSSFPEFISAVAVDSSGAAYVTGTTSSTNFPVQAPLYSTFRGGATDAFVAKLAPGGNSLVFSTYLGGNSSDYGTAITLDPLGNIVVAGYTASANFPAVQPLQTGLRGMFDAFVVRLPPSGGALQFGSLLGGSDTDIGTSVAVDAQRTLHIGGQTSSHDFPLQNAIQTQNFGGYGGFLTRVLSAGTPVAVSVNPSSGSGQNQTFTAAFSDPDGANDLTLAELLINSSLSASQACYVRYDRNANRFLLFDDSGASAAGSLTPGSTGSVQNSQCILLGNSSVSLSGNTLTMAVSLSFKTSFFGNRIVYLRAVDSSARDSGWQQRGTWTTGTPSPAPAAESVSPSSGIGMSQTFTLTFSDPNGATDITWTHITINSSFSLSQACYFAYERAANRFYLANDSATATIGTILPGSTGSVENSQCRLSGQGLAAAASGNTLTLTVPLTFKTGFLGTKYIYMLASDAAGHSSGWQNRGEWTVATGNSAPAVNPVSPSSGSGFSQTFSISASDANGATDIASISVVFNSNLSFGQACYFTYERALNRFSLFNDAGTGIQATISPGASGSVENSQCRISGSGLSVQTSATTITLSLPLTFKSGFAGAKTVYVSAVDSTSLSSGWQNRGSWTVPSENNSGPNVVAVSPSSGTGSTQSFTFTLTDASGGGNISWLHAVFNTSLSTGSACYFAYERASNLLYLANDPATATIGTLTPGSSNTVENSQCILNGSGSSVSVSSAGMAVTVSLTFKPAFRGTKNVYGTTSYTAGGGSGWRTIGTWTIP